MGCLEEEEEEEEEEEHHHMEQQQMEVHAALLRQAEAAAHSMQSLLSQSQLSLSSAAVAFPNAFAAGIGSLGLHSQLQVTFLIHFQSIGIGKLDLISNGVGGGGVVQNGAGWPASASLIGRWAPESTGGSIAPDAILKGENSP